MTRYAVARLDDALAATREFLLPVDLGRWLRLALLSLLVAGGSGGGGGVSSGGGPGVDGGTTTTSWLSEGEVIAVVLAVVAVLLAVALVVGLLAAVAEFTLVESLRSERVALRASLRRFWWRGVRLFAFRLGLFLAMLATVGVLAAVVAAPAVLGSPLVTVAVALVAVPAALAAVVLAVAADRFTALFVVPTMLATDDRRVLAGWRRFWSVLGPQWRQYAVYAGVAIVLALVTRLLVGVAVTAVAVAFLVPFGALALAGTALTTLAWPVGVAVIAVAALGFLVALLAAIGFVEVPVVTFLRFHALLVLGDTDADLDLLGDRRPPLA